MALEFIGGTLFSLLYDGVKKAMGRTTKFKSVLEDLNLTLDSLQPQILQQIGDHNVELGLSNEEIQNLQRQMEAGVKLVGKLSKIGTCKYCCCIWCNCWTLFNCMELNYTEQLAELDRSLRKLLQRLRLQEARDVKELLLLGRRNAERHDQWEKRLADLLKMQQEAMDILKAQQEARDVRIEGNGVQQVASLDGGGGGAAALGAAFRVLFDAIIQVKGKSKMFNLVLGDLESTLDVLQPLIEEMAKHNQVLHLPKEEAENFSIQMVKGVELVHKCSKVGLWATYKSHKYTRKLYELDESLHTLLSILKVQLASYVKKTFVSLSKLESEIKRIEESDAVEIQHESKSWCSVPDQLPSPTVKMDVLNVLGPKDVKETLDLTGVEVAVAEPPFTKAGQDVLNVRGSNDVKQPPMEFLCPISGSLMSDPVVVSSGQTVRALMEESRHEAGIRVSEIELLKGVAERPSVMFSHAATELGRGRVDHFYSSSSEESLVIPTASPPTPLPFATRPSCYSSFSSSKIVEPHETLLNPNSSPGCEEEEELMAKLKSSDLIEQEKAVILLRNLTKTKEELRVSVCTPRLLLALRSLIISRYSNVQTNAVASVVNLSLEKTNKVKIVRSGFVPHLVDVLKGGSTESQEHAAGALLSLALEEDNKMAIGVLGALPPLMHALVRSESERTRYNSALALYHLTLQQSNRLKLVKLNAVPTLLNLAKSPTLADRVLLVLCNLASCGEGRSAMLDANAVECLVGMLRMNELDSESTRENCVAALYALSSGSMRFRGLAREANAVEVLKLIEERGSERAREKAKRLLMVMGGGREDEPNWEGVLESGGAGVVLGATR